MIIIGLIPAALATSPVPGLATETLKDWTLSRCIGKAGCAPFRDDTFESAAALLKRADTDIAVFNRMDALVDRALASNAAGRHGTLTCLDLYHGGELDRLVRHKRRHLRAGKPLRS